MQNKTEPAPINLATLAPAIAAALSSLSFRQWTLSELVTYPRSDGECVLTRADGLALYVVAGGYGNAGRITITHRRPRDAKGGYVVLYPKHGTGQISNPEIKVSGAKDGEQIAKDIVRRLLPDAESVQALAVASIAATNAYEDRRLAMLRAVCEAASIPTPGKSKHNSEQTFNVWIPHPTIKNFESGYDLARVEVRSDYAEIKVDAKGEAKARALIAFLRSPAYLNA